MRLRTGSSRLYGLIGAPIGHSLSPAIHDYWLRQHGIDAIYLPFRQNKPDFLELLRLLHSLDVAGFNITVPYKEGILPHLQSIDPSAILAGAVNTVVVDSEGAWRGYNTDGAGFLQSLREQAAGRELSSVALLGAGGAARAIAAALLSSGVKHLRLTNRHRERAETLAAEMQAAFPQAEIRVEDWQAREKMARDIDLLINTTTLGMQRQPPLLFDLSVLRASAVVADIVYAPLETTLLAEARARGLMAIDGLGMLVGQAAVAFEHWFGLRPVIDAQLRQHLLVPEH